MPKKQNNKNILRQIRDLDNEELKYYACAGYAYAKQQELEEEAKINESFDSMHEEERCAAEFECILNLLYVSDHNKELAKKYQKEAREATIEDANINLAEIANGYHEVADKYSQLAKKVALKGFTNDQVRE